MKIKTSAIVYGIRYIRRFGLRTLIIRIIEKKREKQELTNDEIKYFVDSYVNEQIADYQAAALVMAIFLNGMSKRETYEAKTEEILLPIAEENGVEIYDVEYVKEGSDWYLRAYIDKPDGVNIGDCEAVSRALSDKLDEADFIEDAYILEVSSPGLGRTLKKDKHLEKSLGEEVEIRLYKPVDKCREFTGVLKSYDADSITIDTAEKEMTFARKEIALIRLALDF